MTLTSREGQEKWSHPEHRGVIGRQEQGCGLRSDAATLRRAGRRLTISWHSGSACLYGGDLWTPTARVVRGVRHHEQLTASFHLSVCRPDIGMPGDAPLSARMKPEPFLQPDARIGVLEGFEHLRLPNGRLRCWRAGITPCARMVVVTAGPR